MDFAKLTNVGIRIRMINGASQRGKIDVIVIDFRNYERRTGERNFSLNKKIAFRVRLAFLPSLIAVSRLRKSIAEYRD